MTDDEMLSDHLLTAVSYGGFALLARKSISPCMEAYLGVIGSDASHVKRPETGNVGNLSKL